MHCTRAMHYVSKRKHSMLRKVCTKPVVSASLRGKERRGTREILPADEWLPRPGPVTVAVSPPVKSLASGWTDIVRLRDEVREDIARRSGERLVGTRASGSPAPPRA